MHFFVQPGLAVRWYQNRDRKQFRNWVKHLLNPISWGSPSTLPEANAVRLRLSGGGSVAPAFFREAAQASTDFQQVRFLVEKEDISCDRAEEIVLVIFGERWPFLLSREARVLREFVRATYL